MTSRSSTSSTATGTVTGTATKTFENQPLTIQSKGLQQQQHIVQASHSFDSFLSNNNNNNNNINTNINIHTNLNTLYNNNNNSPIINNNNNNNTNTNINTPVSQNPLLSYDILATTSTGGGEKTNKSMSNQPKPVESTTVSVHADPTTTTTTTSPRTSPDDYGPEALKIKESDWRQQRCKTSTLRFSKKKVLCIYANLFWLCILFGALTISSSLSVTVQEFSPYSDVSECKLEGYSSDASWGKICTVTYTIDYDFPTPIYFYYKLTNVYQNHRKYIQSRSDLQLDGQASDVSTCDPLSKYNGDKLVPCGLIAYSFFNDKYNVTHIDGSTGVHTQLCPSTASTCNGNEKETDWSDASWYYDGTWENENVAWPSDENGKFHHLTIKEGLTNRGELQIWQNVTLPSTKDPDLMVWMRTASSPTFTKLHRINRKLKFKKGDQLIVRISNYFDVTEFDGGKALVISTANVLGGRDYSLAVSFFVVSFLLLVACIVFILVTPPDKIETRPKTNEERRLSQNIADEKFDKSS